MDISLEAVSGKLDEVVVVGYGVQRVTKVSEAISSVKGADIQHQKPACTEDALQGRASGVTVVCLRVSWCEADSADPRHSYLYRYRDTC